MTRPNTSAARGPFRCAASGSEDDNAEACAFLLSAEASFINGEILHVDGGIAAAG